MKVRVTICIDKKHLGTLDKKRGYVSRSMFVNLILDEYLENAEDHKCIICGRVGRNSK